MKRKLLLVFKLLGLSLFLRGQNLVMQAGTSVKTSGNVSINLFDMGINSTGNADLSGSNLYLQGSNNVSLTVNGNFTLQKLYIDKPAATAFIGSNMNINEQLNMMNGWLDLNGKDITLSPTALLIGETEKNRIIGPLGGEIMITVNMNAPNAMNAGNLGAILTSAANMGSVVVKRGHKAQTGGGIPGSINRYFDIWPANNSNLNATFRFTYFNAELNNQNEPALNMFTSTDGGLNWSNQNVTTRDAALNFTEKTGIASFARWALAGAVDAPLPIVGLQFSARRISNDKVQLAWKSLQEINNRGFYVEKKKETDNNFAETHFINSRAPGGNSLLPLEYADIDTNYFAGKTFYRLKQLDIDGHFTYSDIQVVSGEASKKVTLKAWPIPAQGDFFVMIQGTGKDILQVIDVHGQLVQQLTVTDNVQQKINHLTPGVYILRLANQKDIQQKVIVQ